MAALREKPGVASLERPFLLRKLVAGDIDAVATIHCAAFPKSTITRLGKEVVYRYYVWLLEGPHELYAFGATLEHRLVGFCFGGIAPDAIPGFLRQNTGLLFRKLLVRPWLIADPLFRDRLSRGFRTLSRPSSTLQPPVQGAPKRPFDILSIAVRPELQGTGIGKRLMAETEKTALGNGFHVMTLMVNTDNKQAIDFYVAMGWEKNFMKGVWRGNMEKWFDR
jgi:ribosomal protein S18 acetylase RimI-like enzyme